MGKRIVFCLFSSFTLFLLIGCASIGPSVIKTYSDVSDRSQIAILILEQRMGLTVTACDGKFISRRARYVLLQPGRHELWFSIAGHNLLLGYSMDNKKYLDVVGGHTYILKSKGTGLFAIGDKWYPEVFDVTNDSKLHIENLPEESEKK